jgi:hypothetical protein
VGAWVPKCGKASVQYATNLLLNDRSRCAKGCRVVARDFIAAVPYRAPSRSRLSLGRFHHHTGIELARLEQSQQSTSSALQVADVDMAASPATARLPECALVYTFRGTACFANQWMPPIPKTFARSRSTDRTTRRRVTVPL